MKIRMIWIIVMKKPRAKTPTRAICFFIGVSLCVGGWWRGDTFWRRRSWRVRRTGRGRAIMIMSKPRLVPVFFSQYVW